MKNKWIALAVLVAVVVVAAFAQNSQKSSAYLQRYQLTAAQVESESGVRHVVFLLDTQTGQVFRYQFPVTQEDKTIMPDIFYPVQVIRK
jgi:hypothetical protein